MKPKSKTFDKIQKDFRSKFGIAKSSRRHGKKNAQSRLGGLSRKEGRKAARKQKKQRMNATYLSRFSHGQKSPKEVMPEDEMVKKAVEKKGRISRYAPMDSTAPAVKKKLTEKNQSKKSEDKSPQKRGKDKDSSEEEFSDDDDDDETSSASASMAQRKAYDAAAARDAQQLKQLEKLLKLKKRSTMPKAFMEDGLDYLLDVVDADKLKMMSDSEESDIESGSDSDDEEMEEKPVVDKKKKKTESAPAASRTRKVHFADEVEGDGTGESDEEMEDGGSEGEEDEESEQEKSEEEMEDDDGNKEMMEEDDEDEIQSDEAGEDDNDEVKSDEDGQDDDEVTSDEDNDKVTSDEDNDDEAPLKEDIYGRLVNSKGTVVTADNKGQRAAYLPPARRAAMLAQSGQRSLELERLKKQMKGLLNRASESNMQSIGNAVEDLYMSNSRASVNESLYILISEAVVSTVVSPERLVAEMAMLVAILHGNVGSEVGAYFLQQVARRYEELRQQDQYGGEHTMDNVLLLLAYLYNFKVAHHTLLFDVISQLVESFQEKDIELLLLILKCAGFYLRRDDPESLGNQITSIQRRARELEESGTEVPARVRFMLEVLMAVRNNNVRRVPGADIERTDRLQRVAGTCIRGGSLADNQLNVGLKDLLRADETGRWWIVGSAWEGRRAEESASDRASAKTSTATSVVGAVSQKLVRLAKKLRMNSDVRRTIFYVLMSSEDYLDAFQKVLQLGLKGQQEREIVVVAMECCKQEAKFNPFYSFFLEKLAKRDLRKTQQKGHDRRFMMATQFHMWDMFKVMHEMNSVGRQNLALMLAHLLSSKALSLSVLKVLEFGALEKSMVKFLRITMTQLLTTTSTSDLNDIFRQVGQQQKLHALSDGLRVFLVKYMSVKQLEGEQQKVVKNKLMEVCAELSLNRQTVL